MRPILFLALAALFPFTVGAAATPAPGAYEIEVLVFEQRLPELEANEQWTTKAPAPAVTDGITLGITPTTSDLTPAATKLQNDGRYRVLLHRRWVQGADNKTNAKSVVLGGENEELTGYLRFYMNRYLHLELNLAFRPATGAVGTDDGAQAAYRLNEQRRIKSQENHYFDHPKFGAVVRVLPASTAALGDER